MALTLFMDGFDYYATEHIGMKWLNAADYEILPTGGRNGGGCLHPSGYGLADTPVMDGSNGVTIGFAVNRANGAMMDIALRYNDGTDIGFFQIESTGAANIGSITTHSFACDIADGAWRYVELTAINTAGTVTGTLKVFKDTVQVFSEAYSFDTETSLAIEVARIVAGEPDAFNLDDFYIEANISSNGDMRVVAHEADAVANNVGDSWTASDGTTALHDCVNDSDSTESLYIKTTCDGSGQSPNLIEFSSSSLSPLPDTYGTQIVAWMSVDNDATLYAPTFQVDGGAFGAYTPTSAIMEGTTLGYVGSAPGTFGYRGNE